MLEFALGAMFAIRSCTLSRCVSRWRLCVSDVDNVLGFALGAMFVNKTFDGHSKPEAEAMIKVKILIDTNFQSSVDTMRTLFSGSDVSVHFRSPRGRLDGQQGKTTANRQ